MNLKLSILGLGYKMENMKGLEDGIRQLPINLQHLKLDLIWNNLGRNCGNMKYLGKVMKFLP